MATRFSEIVADFEGNLSSIRKSARTEQECISQTRKQDNAVYSAAVMTVARLEEFVRKMGREYAMQFIIKKDSVDKLPDKFLDNAWRKTLENFSKAKISNYSDRKAWKQDINKAHSDINTLVAFINGGTSQDIFDHIIRNFDHIIRNEHGMRASEINSIFNISGLSSVISKVCEQTEVRDFLQERDSNKARNQLESEIDRFIDLRNSIMHKLESTSPEDLESVDRSISLLCAFAKDLHKVLENNLR